jgi:hypothetical protein
MADHENISHPHRTGKRGVGGKDPTNATLSLDHSRGDDEGDYPMDVAEVVDLAVTGEHDSDNNDNDTDDAKMFTATPISEDLWIQLYHHLLVVAALQPSKPVVWLYNTNQLKYFDAYLEGKIATEGIMGPWPLRRDSVGKEAFMERCKRLVKGLRARIKAMSEKNWQAEAAKQLQNPFSPERLWKFIITPGMISQYSTVFKNIGVEGEFVNPEANPELLAFLEAIIAAQYETTTWVHNSSIRTVVLKQKPIDPHESFTPSEGRIIASYETTIPGTSLIYRQQDAIPEILSTPIDTTDLPGTYILPPIAQIKLPTKSRKGHLWKYRESSGAWERADGRIWRPTFVLRQFRRATNEYVRVTANMGLVQNCNPNNYEFLRVFNRWANQWNRRHTGKGSVAKMMWKTGELVVLFTEINKLLKKEGILKYKAIHMGAFKNMVTNKINKATNGSRKGESVASMLRRTKGPIFELIEHAEDIKKRVHEGERLPKKVLFPEAAIAIDQALGVAAVEKEYEDESDASIIEDEDMEEAMVRSKQGTHKRKRGDEEDMGFDEDLEVSFEKKRPRTKKEEDAAQVAAKTLRSTLVYGVEEDDGFEAGLDT